MMRTVRPLLLLPLTLTCLAACGDEDKDPTPAGPADQPPRAFAYASPSVVFEGEVVTLDGRGSSDDKAIASYQWIQVDGPDANIDNDRGALTTFEAPNVTQVAYLRFELEVADTLGYKTRTPLIVTVIDSNATPVAVAGADQIVDARSAVTLDGSASSDNGGSIRSYRWQQVTGDGIPNVTVSGTSSAVATFTAPDVVAPIVLQFTLTVTDAQGSTSSAEARVRVNPKASSLVLLGVPASVAAGATLGDVTVQVRNLANQRINAGDASDLEIIVEVTTGTGALAGTTRRRASQGIAAFSDLSYDTAEEDVVISARAAIDDGIAGTVTIDVTTPP